MGAPAAIQVAGNFGLATHLADRKILTRSNQLQLAISLDGDEVEIRAPICQSPLEVGWVLVPFGPFVFAIGCGDRCESLSLFNSARSKNAIQVLGISAEIFYRTVLDAFESR